MFAHLTPLPEDPILGLMTAFRADPNPDKIDLGVGVYKDEAGNTPIMAAVKQAERLRLDTETTKSYIGPPGEPVYNSLMQQLAFGADHAVIRDKRLVGAQTPGGCGGLRVSGDFFKRCSADAKVWVSAPTWANHIPLLGNAGLEIVEYPYFDAAANSVDFDAMMAALARVPAGDVVLLHACCHNPTGADLSPAQWDAIADLAVDRGFLPFVDMAYQGFGEGLNADAYGIRKLADTVPEMFVVASCSKNFGLYRERIGELMMIGATTEQTAATASQVFNVIRGNYSMPPAHGAAIVAAILSDDDLRQSWETELIAMCGRVNDLRHTFGEKMSAKSGRDFGFIARQKGMFSFLGITAGQVHALKDRHSLYMVDSSRVNIAGLSASNMDRAMAAIASVL